MGDRIWVGYRTEDRFGTDTGPFGSFPIDGTLDGVVLGAQSRNVGEIFKSVELAFMDGAFNLTDGRRSDYEEFQGELLLGFTRSSCFEDLYTTPYAGLRYRKSSNDIRGNQFVADATVDQYVWQLPLGMRSDLMLTTKLAVGLDARMQYKMFDEQIVDSTALTGAFVQETKDCLTYRLEVPISWRALPNGEVTIKPFYEWDRFDSRDGTRSTRIDERGINFLFSLLF